MAAENKDTGTEQKQEEKRVGLGWGDRVDFRKGDAEGEMGWDWIVMHLQFENRVREMGLDKAERSLCPPEAGVVAQQRPIVLEG